eukprot:8378159-Karenia_brevis.AAC.1
MCYDDSKSKLGDDQWVLLKVKHNSKLRDIVQTSVSQSMPSDIKEKPDIETFFSKDMWCDPDYDHEEDGSDSSTSCPPLVQSEDDEQHDPMMELC